MAERLTLSWILSYSCELCLLACAVLVEIRSRRDGFLSLYCILRVHVCAYIKKLKPAPLRIHPFVVSIFYPAAMPAAFATPVAGLACSTPEVAADGVRRHWLPFQHDAKTLQVMSILPTSRMAEQEQQKKKRIRRSSCVPACG